MNVKLSLIPCLLILLLLISLRSSLAPTGRQNTILRTTTNNIRFTLGNDLVFHRIVVNATQLRLDQSYTTNMHTRYFIYVLSPSNVNLTVQSWFATANSSATLTISAPTSTNLAMGFYSPELITASLGTGQRVSQSYNSANQTLNFVVNTDVSSTFTIFATVTETRDTNYAPENYSFNVTDMEGCGNWVFSQEQYYHFEATYWDVNGWSDLDTVQIAFSDVETWMNLTYDVSAGTWAILSGEDKIRLQDGSITIEDSNFLTVVWLIYFEDRVLDTYNVDVYLWCNDTLGATDNWDLMGDNTFNIYALGGRATYEVIEGDGGRIVGGDVFDIYAKSTVDTAAVFEANITFRNLAHVKLLPLITFNNSFVNFHVEYNLDYCLPGDEWVQGLRLDINPMGATSGTKIHVNATVLWSAQGVGFTSERISMYPATVTGGNSTFRPWVDLWFNKINSSTTMGGRANAYQYPMTDSSHSWLRWLTGSNWGIDELLKKQSMKFADIKDLDGNIVSTKEIQLVRLRVKITANKGGIQNIVISDHDVFDLTLGSIPLSGVQTPVFDETQVPALPSGGFLGALWSHLTGLFNWIAEAVGPALLEFFDLFVGFLDSVAGFFGAPGLFSLILGLFSNFWGWFSDAIVWSVGLITTGMTVATLTLAKFGNTVATVVGQWVAMIQSFFNFLGGSYSAGISVWDDLGLATWLLLGAILYPLYLMEVAATKGIDAAISQVEFLINIGAFIVSGLLTIVKMAINLIVRVIESIPVVE